MIRFSCPKCGLQYEIEDEFAGVHAVCEGCNIKMTIPSITGEEFVVAQIVENQTVRQSEVGGTTPNGNDVVKNETLAHSDSGGHPYGEPISNARPSPRQRRLMADWKNLQQRFSDFRFIRIKSFSGNPPEKYVIGYNIRGIERVDGERILYRNYHEVEIKLPGTYPRTPPLCRMLTPIFHPNIEPAVVCIGDHWTAAERLCDLIVRIGEMIAYQAHNVKSPLDGEAAMWTDLHMDMLPVDNSDLTPPDL